MALIKKRTVNHIDHEYWVVEKHENLKNKKNKCTELILMLYTSKEARNAGQDPILRERFQWSLSGNDKTSAEAYAHVKLSRKETKPTLPEETPIEVEVNEFVTAEDDI